MLSLAVLHSRAVSGIAALPVTIEVHLSRGLPGLGIVGLAETAVKESRHRVRSAILNAGFEYPNRRIIVNLAPADLPKEGGGFDLPIALGILAASGQLLKTALVDVECFGELALDGRLRPMKMVLPIAIAVSASHRQMILPADNVPEANLVSPLSLLPATHLSEVVAHLNQQTPIVPVTKKIMSPSRSAALDLQAVIGQQQAKRALEIAASGQHHLLFMGPPGSGKTLLASRLPGILPPMTPKEFIETAVLQSVGHQGFDVGSGYVRPFRSPHHTASSVALIGGGGKPRPGEVSLAHNGVLFLDELPEFQRHVLEVLREPLESGEVVIARALQTVRYPAGFQLIAAMNPCPCGYLGECEPTCRCTDEQITRYRHKISGPLLDRIDLKIVVRPVSAAVLFDECAVEEASAVVQQRVMAARARQLARAGKPNGRLRSEEVKQYCGIDVNTKALLKKAIAQFHLSTRAVHRVLKVSRTIADLASQDQIAEAHVAEALGFRLD